MHATFTGRKTVFLTQGNMYSSLTGAKTAFAYICSNSNIAFGHKLSQAILTHIPSCRAILIFIGVARKAVCARSSEHCSWTEGVTGAGALDRI